MMRRPNRFLPFALAVALGACAADDSSYYQRALKYNGAAAAGAKAATTGEPQFHYQLGDLAPAHRPDPRSDEAGIWYQIDKAERRVKTSGERYRNDEVNAYLKSVACRVTGPYCRDVRVYAVHAPGLNAFMAANGMMVIQTGLLLRVRNEAQLAAVIGHEAGHYLRQHTLQQMRDVIDKTNSLVFFNFVLAAAGIPIAGDVAMIMAVGDIQAYSRNHEREADGYGILLMSRAGYDPDEAWKIWDLTVKETKAIKDAEERSVFLSSHPQPEERMEELRKLAKAVKTPKSADTGRERFQKMIAPIRASLLRDELNGRRFGAFEVVVDQLIEDGENLAELYYFKGEMHRLRGKEGDLEESLEYYTMAELARGTAPPGLKKSIGMVQHKLGRSEAARRSFAAYLKDNPAAADAGIVRQLIRGAGK